MTQHTPCHSERNLRISWKRNVRLVLIVLLSPMWRREVARQRRREDCCLNIRKSFFYKDKGNYKTSILFSLNFAKLNSASFPASWGSQGVIVYVCEKIPPLGESKTILFNSTVSQSTLPRDERQRFACST